jgi:TonB family protein
MKQFFLSVLVVGIIFLIYLKFETPFFDNISLTTINNNESYADADTAEALSAEVVTDSVYAEDAGALMDAAVAGTSDATTEGVMDASKSDAEFPGGTTALRDYIEAHLKYPEDEKKRGVYGTSIVQFLVNTDGTISAPIIIHPIKNGPKCNKEVIRLIQSMPNWSPATIDGKDIPSLVTLPVKFELGNKE